MSNYLHQAVTHELHKFHKRYGFDPYFHSLADRAGVIVRAAEENSCMPANPPIIFLNHFEAGRRRNSFTGMHELCHLVVKFTGLEAEIYNWYGGDAEAAEERIERLCDYGAATFLMPDRMLKEVLAEHGHSALAVYHLMQNSGSSLGAALRRFVYKDPDDSTAGVILSGRTISDVARLNYQVPFWRGRLVPEGWPPIHQCNADGEFRVNVHELADLSCFRIPGTRRTIGVFM